MIDLHNHGYKKQIMKKIIANITHLVRLATIGTAASALSLVGAVASASAHDVTPKGWCTHSGSYIVLGNFDGKGGRDALCADSAGAKWINYENGKKWDTKSPWCTHSGARIYAVHLDKNKKQDLQCRDNKGGKWNLISQNGRFKW